MDTVVYFGVDYRVQAGTEGEERDEAARRRQAREVLVQLQEQGEVREVALRPAAAQPRTQEGLSWSPPRHEKAMHKSESSVVPKIKVQAVRIQPPDLELMKGRNSAPMHRDPAKLPGGGKLGKFWHNCKSRGRCVRPPYDRLLSNPVLRADYRTTATA